MFRRGILRLFDLEVNAGQQKTELIFIKKPVEERTEQFLKLREHVNLRFELEGLREGDPYEMRMRWVKNLLFL